MFKEMFVAAQGGKGAAGRASQKGQSKANAMGMKSVPKVGMQGTNLGMKSVGRQRMAEKASRLKNRREK